MQAFRLAYDGTAYRGFQRQPDVPTVEDAVFDALRALDVLEGDRPAGYAAAGRTDAGVSALAQTVAFEAPDWLSPAALNSRLPADVRAWASADASPAFHATYDAAWREYVYHHYAPGAALDRAREALSCLEGTHDFHNLTPDDGDATRTLRSASVDRDGDYLAVALRADGFCRQQVRRTVGLVDAVTTGDRPLDFVDRALSAERLTGPEGVAPARPEPLVLTGVRYPDLSFAVDERAAASAREVFEGKRVDRRTAARVAATVADGLQRPELRGHGEPEPE